MTDTRHAPAFNPKKAKVVHKGVDVDKPRLVGRKTRVYRIEQRETGLGYWTFAGAPGRRASNLPKDVENAIERLQDGLAGMTHVRTAFMFDYTEYHRSAYSGLKPLLKRVTPGDLEIIEKHGFHLVELKVSKCHLDAVQAIYLPEDVISVKPIPARDLKGVSFK